MAAKQITPDNTVITNPVVKQLEKHYTDGRKIARIIDFQSEVDNNWGESPATISVTYTDGNFQEIILDQTLQAFLNTAYAFA